MNRLWRRIDSGSDFFHVTSDEGEHESPVHDAQQVVKEERQAGVKALYQLKHKIIMML
jgi:hypothetical protein